MKELSLISGKTFYLSDDEAENVKLAIQRGGFIELRNGDFVNVSSISTLTEVRKVEYWSTYVVNENANGKFINRDGEQCYLDPRNMEEIHFDYPPEVKLLIGESIKKLDDGYDQRRIAAKNENRFSRP